jgi:hypothetical protein
MIQRLVYPAGRVNTGVKLVAAPIEKAGVEPKDPELQSKKTDPEDPGVTAARLGFNTEQFEAGKGGIAGIVCVKRVVAA